MSVYCQFYDNKQNLISEQIVSSFAYPIPSGAVSGLFYDNTYKIDGLKLNFNNSIFDFSFISTKDYFLYVFPPGYTYVLATSVRSSSFLIEPPSGLTQSDIDYLKNLSDNSTIDFSTIVTALNSISSALSALSNLSNLTSLSNLAELANIIVAISDKDNQSNIVSELNKIFINNFEGVEYSALKLDTNVLSEIPDDSRTRYTLTGILARLMSLLTSNRRTLASYFYAYNSSNFRTNNSSLFENATKTSFQNLHDISEKLNNIETKLEQNLPFTTIVNNDYIDNCVSATVAYNKKIENIPFN